MANNHNSYLTEDLIIEIMLKLPLRSLLRFKSISKGWLSIITNHPYLSNLKPFVILQRKASPYRLALFCDPMMNRPKDLNIISSMKTIYIHGERVSLVGSCHGVLCLMNNRGGLSDIILWNPATKEYRCLPISPLSEYDHQDCAHTNFVLGFGFHHEAKDYKVLRCRYGRRIFEAEVFTLSKSSWRQVEDINIPRYDYERFFFARNNSLVIKGVCYHLLIAMDPKKQSDLDYIAWRKNDANLLIKTDLAARYGYRRSFILNFDMGNETFSKIAIGLPYDGRLNVGANLMVYQDLLAMMVRKDEESSFNFELWAMKNEYSWTKQFIIREVGGLQFIGGIWNGEGIILQQIEEIDCFYYDCYLYDTSTEKLKKLPRRTEQFGVAHDYAETEVSVYHIRH